MNTAHRLADGFRSVISYWTPTPTTSQFLEKGTLTPQEFVDAGDQLAFKFPTWSWQKADGRRHVSWLPADKQYLATFGVSCRCRVRDLDKRIYAASSVPWEEMPNESWLVPAAEETSNQPEACPDITSLTKDLPDSQRKRTVPISNSRPDMHNGVVCFDEIDDFLELSGSLQDEDRANVPQDRTYESNESDSQSAARTYDLSVTYDKYYQSPRLWLKGHNGQGLPLESYEIFEDILTDYVSRTVTIDPHPCTGQPTVSIHPCRHAAVMLKVVHGWQNNGIKPRHDLALVVLLKLISSVIPSIEYDTTTDIYGFSLGNPDNR